MTTDTSRPPPRLLTIIPFPRISLAAGPVPRDNHSPRWSLEPVSKPELWSEATSLHSIPFDISGSHYGDIKPLGSSWYGSLGTIGRSPLINHYDCSSGNENNYSSNRQMMDPSNMSPFVWDDGQILLDDSSTLRELWAGMNPPKAAVAVARPACDTASASSSHADP